MAVIEDGFRKGAGICLINRVGAVFLGHNLKHGAFEMPQGGSEEGENPLDTMIRELPEETGTREAIVLAFSAREHDYEFLRDTNPKYRGQRQSWSFQLFYGPEDGINIHKKTRRCTPEFSHYIWASPSFVMQNAPKDRRDMYCDLIAAKSFIDRAMMEHPLTDQALSNFSNLMEYRRKLSETENMKRAVAMEILKPHDALRPTPPPHAGRYMEKPLRLVQAASS